MLVIETLRRSFNYNGTVLADPNPSMSVEEVQRFHSTQFPELATAKPRIESSANGQEQRITFTTSAGVKG